MAPITSRYLCLHPSSGTTLSVLRSWTFASSGSLTFTGCRLSLTSTTFFSGRLFQAHASILPPNHSTAGVTLSAHRLYVLHEGVNLLFDRLSYVGSSANSPCEQALTLARDRCSYQSTVTFCVTAAATVAVCYCVHVCGQGNEHF